MKVNLNEEILNLNGEPFSDAPTVGGVLLAALLTPMADENPSIEEKVKTYRLAQKIAGADEVDLPMADAVFLRERVGKIMGNVVVVGRVFDALGGD